MSVVSDETSNIERVHTMGFDDEHKDIELAVIRILLSLVPEGWASLTLDVSVERQLDGTISYPMHLSGADGAPAMIFPPDDLCEAVVRSHVRFEAVGRAWAATRYSVAYDYDADKWRFTVDYS